MDMRPCPSYEAGFDACDPLRSVLEWSRREPARVRRRCYSEGLDRSPFEDVPMHRSIDGIPRQHRALSNKSHFTLNNVLDIHSDRLNHEFSLTAAENGDYIMAHELKKLSHHSGRKMNRSSPTRPLLITTLSNTKIEDNRLPKVEEMFEKVDQEMHEVPKQPLKSILNNPLTKSPQSILKKPKNRSYHDGKDPMKGLEGRRRQRASSESDNLYGPFYVGYDTRLTNNMSNAMKKAKDNSGHGYSYGTAIASLGYPPPPPKNNINKYARPKEYPQSSNIMKPKEDFSNFHILRTTAINNDPVPHADPILAMPGQETISACPPISPALPVSSAVTDVPLSKKIIKSPSKKKAKAKNKIGKMKTKAESGELETEIDASDSPTKNLMLNSWAMETDVLLAEIEKLEDSYKKSSPKVQSQPPPPPPSAKSRVPVIQPKAPPSQANLPPPPSPATAPPAITPAAIAPAVTAPPAPTPPATVPPATAPPATVPPASALPDPAQPMPPVSKRDELPEYINHIRLAPKHIGPVPVTKKTPSKESLVNLPEIVSACLRPSLFPRVPPYLKFIGHDESPALRIPLPIQKHLKWKLTTITPIVVKKTLVNSGFKLVKSECDTSECPQEETVDWIGIWGKHMKSILFRAIKDGQKMNHFPGTFQIGRKDRLWRNLQKLASRHGKKEFGIMPKTYVLPHDLKLLKQDWEKHVENNERWIIKPPASARGTGIKVVSRWTQIPKKRPVVVQRYITKPYLINGSKFDLRLYVLITSVHPLRIYLYKDGLARFASVKYNDEISSLGDRYMHLTNYSINRLSKNYTPNEDYAACEGHKWTLQTLLQYLKTERGVNTKDLWSSLKDLVVKTIISGEASISSLTKVNITSRYNCYELFGIDVLLDEDLKPWLLEVNISPSLHSASPLDIHVKGPLVATVLNIAQFQIPNKINLDMLTKEKPHKLGGLPYDSRLYTIYLSKEERDKHIIYTNMEDRDMYLRDILSTLTPDDVRHLIQAEDELTQATEDMERVFPTYETYKYLNYLAGPRYYNRLFDAWEFRYSFNRESGVELLRNLCDIGYHLEVPPVPLKNDVDAPTPIPSERPSLPSVTSMEPSASSSPCSLPEATRDAIPAPTVPPPLEPRA